MIDIETILTYLTLISVPVGVFYHIMMLRNAQKAGQTQLLMQLYQTKSDPQALLNWFTMLNMNWKDFDDFNEKYSRFIDPKHFALVESHISYFEGLGVLLMDKKIDSETVYNLLGRRILMVWSKFGNMIAGWRDMDHGPGPDYALAFESLVDEMVKIRVKRGLPLYEGRLKMLGKPEIPSNP